MRAIRTPARTLFLVFDYLILTLVGICLIIFLLLLMISVVQNVADFALNIYKELSLRLYD